MSLGKKASVFVVDDDEAVRESLEALLLSAELSVEVAAFESGGEFLKQLPENSVGCILLDVRMPDLSGLDVQAILKDRGCNLAVIIITGHGDVAMAVEAMRAGAFHFVEKPFTDEALICIVGEAVEWSAENLEARVTQNEAALRIGRLSRREREVLDQLVQGRPNKVIAYELGISVRTVEVHRARLMEKTQCRSFSELVRLALSVQQN